MRRPVRGYLAEYLGSNKAVFICPDGHRSTLAVIEQPKAYRKLKRDWTPSEDIIQRMVRYWAKEHGGVNFVCRQCEHNRKKGL